jgi:L-glyceraldehyde 3-phosphate reductase
MRWSPTGSARDGGAHRRQQLEQNVAALRHGDFSIAELAETDRHATESNINIWADSSTS